VTKKDKGPIPQGLYRAAVRDGMTIQTSGMTPRRGNELVFEGCVGKDDDPAVHREAVRLATSNALSALRLHMREGERVIVFLHLAVFIATEPGFTRHATLADYASELLSEECGEDTIGSRAAIGVVSLPSNAPVEIVLNAKLDLQ